MPFGISTRLTGGGLYCLARSRACSCVTLVSSSLSNSFVVSPSTPLAPRWFICFHVSMRNPGVSRCANDVKRSFRSVRALSAMRASFVFTFVCLCVQEMCPCHACCSVPRLPHVRGFPALRVLRTDPTSYATSAFVWLVLSVGLLDNFRRQDRIGSPRFLDASFSTRAVLSDPAGVSGSHGHWRLPTLAFQVFDPVGLRTIFTRLNRFTCVTARVSLCLRLAHVVTFISPRLDSRWIGSSPCRGGNRTHWKHQACPGAPKKPRMSASSTQFTFFLQRPTASASSAMC